MMNLNVKLNDGTIGLMKIAIVAGGTGGHIYPALTLAEELEKEATRLSSLALLIGWKKM